VSDTPLPPDPLWAPEAVSPGRLGWLALLSSVFLFIAVGASLQVVDPALGIWFSEIFLFFGTGWVLTRWSGRDPVAYAGLGWPGAAPVVLGLLLAIGNYVGLVVPLQFFSQALAPRSWTEAFDQMQIFDRYGGLALAFLSAGAILAAPLGEELIFRGLFLQGLLRSGWRTRVAILVSAAIFSAVHLDPVGFLARMELGALFGILFVRSANLWPGMAAHFGTNLTATLLYFAGRGDPTPTRDLRGELPGVLVASAVGVAFMAVVLLVARRVRGAWGTPMAIDPARPRVPLRKAAALWVIAALTVLASWGILRWGPVARPSLQGQASASGQLGEFEERSSGPVSPPRGSRAPAAPVPPSPR